MLSRRYGRECRRVTMHRQTRVPLSDGAKVRLPPACEDCRSRDEPAPAPEAARGPAAPASSRGGP